MNGVRNVWRATAATLCIALVAGCGPTGPIGPRASQGDIALCYYVRDSEFVGLKARGEGGLLDDATDGQLIGRAIVAERTPRGSAERNAVVARCRELGAL